MAQAWFHFILLGVLSLVASTRLLAGEDQLPNSAANLRHVCKQGLAHLSEDYLHRRNQLVAQGKSTHEAFAAGEVPSGDLKAPLMQPAFWIAERQAIHKEILGAFESEIERLSQELASSPFVKEQTGKPVLVMTRGNSGSGKTFALANSQDPFLVSVGIGDAVKRHEGGVINPDSIKANLQKREAGKVSNQQVHEEGSALAERLLEKSLQKGLNIVLDKRFGTPASIDNVAQKAKALGYRIVVIDVDAPVEVSSERVLNRTVGGGSPNVPLDPILIGFDEAREYRNAVSELPVIDDYFSFAMPLQGQGSLLVASRRKGEPLAVHYAPEWEHVTKGTEPLEKQRTRALYGDLLNALASTLPAEFLRPYHEEGIQTAIQKDRPTLFKWSSINQQAPTEFYLLPGDFDSWAHFRLFRPKKGDRFVVKWGWWSKPTTYEFVEESQNDFRLREISRGKVIAVNENKLRNLNPTLVQTAENLEAARQSQYRSLLSELQEYRYQATKTGEEYYHQRLANAVNEFLKRTVPGIQFESRVIPASDTRDIAIELVLKNVDKQSAIRLLNDREWGIAIKADSSSEKPDLIFSTRHVSLTNPRVTTEEKPTLGIGFDGVNGESPESMGHQFIKARTDMAIYEPARLKTQNEAPAMQITIASGGGVGFSRKTNATKHSRGFRSDEPRAYVLSVQIELHHAKKQLEAYRKSGNPENRTAALKLIENARGNLSTAFEYAGYLNFALENTEPIASTARQGSSPLTDPNSPMNLHIEYPMVTIALPNSAGTVRAKYVFSFSSRQVPQYQNAATAIQAAKKQNRATLDNLLVLSSELDAIKVE